MGSKVEKRYYRYSPLKAWRLAKYKSKEQKAGNRRMDGCWNEGFPQEKLGKLVGVSGAYINMIQNGKRRPRETVFKKVVDVTGIDPDLFALSLGMLRPWMEQVIQRDPERFLAVLRELESEVPEAIVTECVVEPPGRCGDTMCEACASEQGVSPESRDLWVRIPSLRDG